MQQSQRTQLLNTLRPVNCGRETSAYAVHLPEVNEVDWLVKTEKICCTYLQV